MGWVAVPRNKKEKTTGMKNHRLRGTLFSLLSALLILTAACSKPETPATGSPTVPTGTVSATPITPLPTSSGNPTEGAPTPLPTATIAPILVFPSPVPPTIPPVKTPQLSPALSAASIQILSPGPLSKVLSPIRLHGYVIPGSRDLIRVELYGEDNRLIFRTITRTYGDYRWNYFSMEIPFDTKAAAELARLQVSTNDDQGNTIALMSVHLLLQSDGYEEINPPGSLDERCQLDVPQAGDAASHGVLTVDGKFLAFNEEPVILEVFSWDGTLLGSQWVPVPAGGAGSEIPILTNVGFAVNSRVKGRLVVRQFDDRINGNMYLFSVPVVLNP